MIYQEKQIELLHEVSKAMTKKLDLNSSLQSILSLLEKFLNMKRGTIVLLDEETNIINIEAAHGISPAHQKKGSYKIGEGITGKVVLTGEAEIVPHTSTDSRFLNRMGLRDNEDVSFICVPIKISSKTMGALSVDIMYDTEAYFKQEIRLLNIVASMIGQTVHLYSLIKQANQKLLKETQQLRNEMRHRYQMNSIIGCSKKMNDIFDLITQVAPTNTTVLIRGETGTGKELIAHAIHYNSLRANKPFIKVNCAAFPESLLESELFGHEKGAFTGASQQKSGRFEWANKGSLFIDEIAELPQSTQIKLLRTIQFKEFERIGGKETIKVDTRIICATNKNIEEAIVKGEFREDFYYRINVFPIYVPSLRERKADIIPLADTFLVKYSKESGKPINRISTPAIDLLMSYHWPGNVRELENCIERAVVLCNESTIRVNHLPPSLQIGNKSKGTLKEMNLPLAVENMEKELIIEALKNNKGNQGKAASELGITKRMIGYKIQKYSIMPKIYSPVIQKYTKT